MEFCVNFTAYVIYDFKILLTDSSQFLWSNDKKIDFIAKKWWRK